jgi:phosphoribosylformylglycinamidine (FGAM) synthase PurS component
MNIHQTKWFATLNVSGQKEIMDQGPLTGVFTRFLAALQTMSVRDVKEGKVIVIRLSDRPLDSKTKTKLEEENELWAQIDTTQFDDKSGPMEGESYQTAKARLILEGLPESHANWYARNWFPDDAPESAFDLEIKRQAEDPLYFRFKQLHFISSEFKAALPSEYIDLARHVISEYPEWSKTITFRIAF